MFRVDSDYAARRHARKFLGINDPDYYEWETHIFFDDCMKKSKLEKVMEGIKYFKSKIPCRAKLDSGRKT